MIVAMSADDGHDIKAAQKSQGGVLHYLAVPSIEELEVMLPIITPNVAMDVFRERIAKVGPLPRYLVDEGKFLEWEVDRERALNAIKDNSEAENYLESGGWVRKQNTLPSTLLAVAGAQLEKIGDQVLSQDFVDYVGQHVDYQKRRFDLLGDEVEKAFFGKAIHGSGCKCRNRQSTRQVR
jgi:hypothetical protein